MVGDAMNGEIFRLQKRIKRGNISTATVSLMIGFTLGFLFCFKLLTGEVSGRKVPETTIIR